MTKKRRQGQKGVKDKGQFPAELSSAEDNDDEEEVSTPKKGKASFFAEALADAQAELEAQGAIPAAGKESGKESVDSAKLQSDGALNAVIN